MIPSRASGSAALALITGAADFDIDDAGFGFLAQSLSGAAAARQHVVGCDRGMTHESSFGARREEARAQVMISSVGGKYERRIGVVELACDCEHLYIIEGVGIENHTRRIAGERGACKGIDLVDLDTARHRLFYGPARKGGDSSPF